MSEKVIFIIFCMEYYKTHKSITGKEVSDLFEKYKIYDYLQEFYDVLHTTGEQYIDRDLDAYLAARGVG